MMYRSLRQESKHWKSLSSEHFHIKPSRKKKSGIERLSQKVKSICSNSGAKALRSTRGTLDTNEGGRTEGMFQKAWNPQCFWKEPHMRLIQTENFLLGA